MYANQFTYLLLLELMESCILFLFANVLSKYYCADDGRIY